MNWLDIVLALLIGASVISAFLKGFSRELVGFVAAIAALVLGSWFYGTAAGYLVPYVSSKAMANFLGFLLVFCAVLMLGALVARILRTLMKAAGLSIFDRLLGAGFGFVRAVLVVMAVMMAVMAFSPGRKAPRAVVESRLAPYVMDAARVCTSMAPYELREGFRTSYQEVKSVWNGALKKDVPAPRKHKDTDERPI
jgi:membrane protein required for colicin V production